MLESYYRINQAIGASINLLPDGNILVDGCGIVVKENRLDFEKKIIGLNNVQELIKHFPAKSYLAVNLFGKGILQKQIEKIEEIDQNNFTQILPNANKDDFYIQNFISGDKSFISIIRRTEADKWIELLKEQGFIPLMLSLGPSPVQNIISQLNAYDNELIFNGHIIQRNEGGEWVSYQYKENTIASFPLKIESEPINEKLLIAYSVAFQLVLADRLMVIQAHVPSLETTFNKHITNKKLQVKGLIALSAFFILLVINFLLFSWLNSDNMKLADQLSRSTQSINDIQGINDQLKNKELLLKNLGWDGGIGKSKLIDQLASLLPRDISWREVTINPIDASVSRIQKTLQFKDRRIHITGISEKIIPVNEWIARVKTQKWVKNIQLDSYIYNNELNTGQFAVIIDY